MSANSELSLIEAPEILLASGSPRRREILEAAGYRFQVVAAGEVPEVEQGDPVEVVRVNSQRKAEAFRDRSPPLGAKKLVLGADTVVVLDQEILGKPRDRDHAREMLSKLAGRTHDVVSGIFLLAGSRGGEFVFHRTQVEVGPIPSHDLEWLLSRGEASDKAGAYGIQGSMSPFVLQIRGCYFNVMGLSPASLELGIQNLGFDPPDFRTPGAGY